MTVSIAGAERSRLGRSSAVWLSTLFLLLGFFLAVDSMIDDSPTMDEQNHIARGLAFLRTGDSRLSLEHPPLVNSLSAGLLLTLPDIQLPTDHPSWERREGWYEFADLLLWQYNHDVERMVFLARMPIVYLLLLLAVVGYRFALRLWGRLPAVLALGLLLFEPNLLAHGRYATTDMGAVLFSFVATYALWSLWQHPERWDWKGWFFAAVAMSLAFGSKLSTLGFVPVWLVLALLPVYPAAVHSLRTSRPTLRRVLQLLTAGLLATLFVWLIYGFEWGRFAFVTDNLDHLNNLSGPMPTFWEGLEQALLLSSQGRATSFLLGRFSDDGFLAYYPVALGLKTPIILLVLAMIAAVVLLVVRPTRRRALFLLSAWLLYFLVVMTSALNIGYRHALPALPYLLVLVSGLAAPELRAALGRSRATATSYAVIVGLALTLLASIWIHPHYLSYFNVLAGGPENGYKALSDSNIDWGQDLLRLQEWMARNDVDSVRLGWFGSADPAYYGLENDPLPGVGRERYFLRWWDVPFDREMPEPGIYAISVSNLWEPPLRESEKNVYAWFREHEPNDRIGYSILIYDLRDSSAN